MRITLLGLLALMGVLFLAAPAMAEGAAGHGQDEGGGGFVLFRDKGAAVMGGAMGAGLVIMGAAAGIGRITASAAESMARQPEVAPSINTIALVTAAMLEGATLFAVLVCMLAVFSK